MKDFIATEVTDRRCNVINMKEMESVNESKVSQDTVQVVDDKKVNDLIWANKSN